MYAVLRDRRGFVWAGTPDGLNRFDGYEILRYLHDPDDPATLSHQIVRCLLEDRRGNLWIGTDNSLSLLDRAAHRFIRVPLGTERRKVFTLFEDSRGKVWVGTDEGVFRLRSDRTFLRLPFALEGDVRDFAESPGGVVWGLVQNGTESALHAFDGSDKTLTVAESWGWTTNFAIDGNGRFWLKPPLAARVDSPTGVLEPVIPPERDLVVHRVRLDRGDVWMATNRGLCYGPGSGSISCRPVDPTASWLQNHVRDLWLDGEGAVWYGTYSGLSRFDPHAKPFETWVHDRLDPRTISGDAVSAIVEDEDGLLWVATFGAGLNRLNRAAGEATRFRSDPNDPRSLLQDTIWALLLDPDHVLWIATEWGLASFDTKQNRFTRHRLPFPPEERLGRRTTSIARDQTGLLWIAAGGRLYSYDPRTRASRRHPLPRGLTGGAEDVMVDTIVVDEDGALWAGTGSDGLLKFDPKSGKFEVFARLTSGQAPLSSEGLWDIEPSGADALWIGTGMGLSRFDRSTKQFVNYLPRDGLPASFIYSILEDRRGRLWLGTSRGLVLFDPRESGPKRFRTFDKADGVASQEFNRHAKARTRSGEFCFGGVGGLTCFDPERIEDDRRPPRVALTGIEMTEGPRTITLEAADREAVELRHDNDPFAFTFAALSFANPQKNLYQYKLENFDRGWIDAGTRRQARYTNVPPGEYVFHVRASNADLTWNLEGLSIPVRILPPFWVTWWFRGLMVAIAASLLYALYRYRLTRLLEMERLRLRISSDLHDDVTSELAGISMLAELVRRRLPQDRDAEQQLSSLRDRSAALASVMRDFAWGIHPEHDTAGSMIRRMRSAGSLLLGNTPLRLDVEGLDDEAELPMIVRRAFFLVYKEALHNAARHAGARDVRVHLRSWDHTLEMAICDDGQGFDPDAVHSGDGLRNMRRRAGDAGGTIEVSSGTGRGTRIVVRAPIRPPRGHEDSGWIRRDNPDSMHQR